MTDAAVVRRVLEGDIEAFGILVDRYYDRYARYAVHITGNEHDAQEALQDAFLRAYRALSRYEERERFAAWLYRIVVNECRTLLAQRRRAQAPLEPLDAASIAAAPDDAEDEAAARERLAAMLSRLPVDQREALVLRYVDDLTFDEMAAVTGIGVSALKMRVRRALDRLRTLTPEQRHVLL